MRSAVIVGMLSAVAILTTLAIESPAARAEPETVRALKQFNAANKIKSANNLKQIAIAMHAYHNDFGHFPAASIARDGKPLLSWRVAILPYIEENALHQQFKLDEPWDSEHNKKLLERMPKLYAPVGVAGADPQSTFYQVFVGKDAAFDPIKGRKIGEFRDGTSYTFLVIEAGDAVPWTKPADLPYDAEKPLPKRGGLFRDGFHAAMSDGGIRFIKNTVDEKTLRALITPSGAEAVNLDALP
jgi:hypothetical protein